MVAVAVDREMIDETHRQERTQRLTSRPVFRIGRAL